MKKRAVVLVERYGSFTQKIRSFFENERSYFGKDADKYAKQGILLNNYACNMLYLLQIGENKSSAGYEIRAYCIKMKTKDAFR